MASGSPCASISLIPHRASPVPCSPITVFSSLGFWRWSMLFQRKVLFARSNGTFSRPWECPGPRSEPATRTSRCRGRMARPYRLDRDWKLVEPNVATPPFDQVSAAAGIISTVNDLAKLDAAIDEDKVYSPPMKEAAWTPGTSPTGQKFPYGLGWFVFGGSNGIDRMIWHYGWYPDAFSSLWFKLPERRLTFILLACTDIASSVFWLVIGDPLRSAFVTAFLDTFLGDRSEERRVG